MRSFAVIGVVAAMAVVISTLATPTHAFVPGLDPFKGDQGGGFECAACTIAIGLLEQIAEIRNKSVEVLLDEVCDYFPSGPIQSACTFLVNTYGAEIIEHIANHETGDDICRFFHVCTDPTCQLWPPYSATTAAPKRDTETRAAADRAPKKDWKAGPAGLNPWEELKKLINDIANLHQPIWDLDADKFSTEQVLRGSSWRGDDCDDEDAEIYPGRRVSTKPPSVDHNCNGIKGTNNDGDAWEDVLCGGTTPLRLLLIGDSVGAHFQIPPKFLTAADINDTTYDHALFDLSNEFDVPEKSWGTGYEANQTNTPVNSLYLKIRERNQCSHRMYQNCGVNGAASGAVASSLVTDIASDQANDYPASLIFELVGNDVCHNRLSEMTTPTEFKANILKALDTLNTTLPAGSHIMFIGLADGRILWDSLHNRTHPVGVPYSKVYEYLNCLDLSPCTTWLNPNATIRNATTARAVELSAVYQDIINTTTYKNFDMIYHDFPFTKVLADWVAEGGQAWELIEPVDGFHPNQQANALIAEVLYEWLEANHPSFLGDINPNNAQITSLFGNQGGYGPEHMLLDIFKQKSN